MRKWSRGLSDWPLTERRGDTYGGQPSVAVDLHGHTAKNISRSAAGLAISEPIANRVSAGVPPQQRRTVSGPGPRPPGGCPEAGSAGRGPAGPRSAALAGPSRQRQDLRNPRTQLPRVPGPCWSASTRAGMARCVPQAAPGGLSRVRGPPRTGPRSTQPPRGPGSRPAGANNAPLPAHGNHPGSCVGEERLILGQPAGPGSPRRLGPGRCCGVTAVRRGRHFPKTGE
jgi:hypothetical protein